MNAAGAFVAALLFASTTVAAAPSQEATPKLDPGLAAPYLEGKALRERVPDIELVPWPPALRQTFGVAVAYPFEILGLGFGMEGYVAGLVRLSGFASFGFTLRDTPEQVMVLPGFFAEAAAGVRVLAVAGRIGARVDAAELNEPDWTDPKPKAGFDAWLPATHALLLEGGMLSGTVPLAECSADCDNADDSAKTFRYFNPVLFYPDAGLRYVFFGQASSKLVPAVNREWHLEGFAHAVFRALHYPSQATASMNLEPVKKSPLGARAGFSIGVCRRHCLRVSFTGGYLPSPDTFTFSAGIGY